MIDSIYNLMWVNCVCSLQGDFTLGSSSKVLREMLSTLNPVILLGPLILRPSKLVMMSVGESASLIEKRTTILLKSTTRNMRGINVGKVAVAHRNLHRLQMLVQSRDHLAIRLELLRDNHSIREEALGQQLSKRSPMTLLPRSPLGQQGNLSLGLRGKRLVIKCELLDCHVEHSVHEHRILCQLEEVTPASILREERQKLHAKGVLLLGESLEHLVG